MTELLKKAFSEASRLPKGDQDLIGKWMLADSFQERVKARLSRKATTVAQVPPIVAPASPPESPRRRAAS
jgi:hypothetical protein